MPEGLKFEQIYNRLPYPLDTPPFHIRYGPYAVSEGLQAGYRGQRGMGLVTAYAEGLEAGFEALHNQVFQQTTPEHPIQVAIFHLPDYLFGGLNTPRTLPSSTGPRILLSNRSYETSAAARADRARTEATHEVCHVFQIERRPPLDDPKRNLWEWITEAMAVFSEQFVHRGGAESFFYCQEWLDSPEVPLDLQRYPSSMFVRWYARRFGADCVGRIWEEAGLADTPLEMIEKVAGFPLDDLFTDYAWDAYFLCDSASYCFFPDIHFLWGFREIRERFVLPADTGKQFEGMIDHLAAGYFEIRANAGVSAVECSLECGTPNPILRAQIATVKHNLHRGASAELTPVCQGKWSARLSPATNDEIDHFVVVVSNGSRDRDKIPITLTVTAIP
jgi:hypothetical protein